MPGTTRSAMRTRGNSRPTTQGEGDRQQEDAESRGQEGHGDGRRRAQAIERGEGDPVPEAARAVELGSARHRGQGRGHGAHSGAHDEVDLDAALVEGPQHARVVGARGAAAGEHEGRATLWRVLLHRPPRSCAYVNTSRTRAARSMRFPRRRPRDSRRRDGAPGSTGAARADRRATAASRRSGAGPGRPRARPEWTPRASGRSSAHRTLLENRARPAPDTSSTSLRVGRHHEASGSRLRDESGQEGRRAPQAGRGPRSTPSTSRARTR